ncbi:hypothetical protein Tco_0790550 [Tanacetum coccineum]
MSRQQHTYETQKLLLKDEDVKKWMFHLYRSMIGSLMYLTSSRPDIMFAVCACARYQVNPKVSHLHAVKRILGNAKKQIVVANSTTEAEYVAATILLVDKQCMQMRQSNEEMRLQIGMAATTQTSLYQRMIGKSGIPMKMKFLWVRKMHPNRGGIADIDNNAGINLKYASKDVNLKTRSGNITTSTAADILVTAASTRPKAKGLVIHEQEQAPTSTVSSQQPSQLIISG